MNIIILLLLLLSHYGCIYVVVIFYPLFKFYFPLSWGMIMYDKMFQTKECEIKTKIFGQSLTLVPHSLLQNHMKMLAMQAILSETLYFWGF